MPSNVMMLICYSILVPQRSG